MENGHVSPLEEKVQILIDKYKELKEKYIGLTGDNDRLKSINENNAVTIQTLKGRLEELEADLSAKTSDIEELVRQCEEYKGKLSNFENVTKTASSKIDDILSQLSQL
jgi:chromosome segregation ATPase